MKQYVIDELRPEDQERLKRYLDKNFGASEVEGIYWIPMELEYLTPEQTQHKECGPHFVALVLEQNMLSCEFLVRTKNRVHCNCMGYATQVQRNWIMEFIDALLEALDIKI
ncbi:MAG: hypothetical protein KKA41_03305 [Proteobacteria bacterium]|nr:hypothetical protein [Pseudomonadota bacterium]